MSKSFGATDRGITIADVARHAGVSTGTVSLALNGSSRISPQTRQKVEKAATALCYMPNHAAASLRRQSTKTVALVIPEIGNPIYMEFAKTIQQIAKQRGYHLHLISTEGSQLEERHALDTLARRLVDGLILISLRGTAEFQSALSLVRGPVVVIGRTEQPICDSVMVDSAYGSYLAIRHLWSQSYKRLAFINGLSGTIPNIERAKGVKAALQEIGYELPQALAKESDFTLQGGFMATQELLNSHIEFDGLFCANDLMAIGAIQALRQHGLRVPQDVAVIGMDDIHECHISTPTLSTVSLLAGERGRLAAELLFDRLGGEVSELPRQLTVTPVLIPRASTQEAEGIKL